MTHKGETGFFVIESVYGSVSVEWLKAGQDAPHFVAEVMEGPFKTYKEAVSGMSEYHNRKANSGI